MKNFKFPTFLLFLRCVVIILTALIILFSNKFFSNTEFIDYTFAITSAALGGSIFATVITPYSIRYFNNQNSVVYESLNKKSVYLFSLFSFLVTILIVMKSTSNSQWVWLYIFVVTEFFLSIMLMFCRTSGKVLREAKYLCVRSSFDLLALFLFYHFSQYFNFSVFLMVCTLPRIVILIIEKDLFKRFFSSLNKESSGGWFICFSHKYIKLILISLITRFDVILLPLFVSSTVATKELANLIRIYSLLLQLQSTIFNRQIKYIFDKDLKKFLLQRISIAGLWAFKIFICISPLFLLSIFSFPYIGIDELDIPSTSAISIYLIIVVEAYLGPVLLVKNVIENEFMYYELLIWIVSWVSLSLLFSLSGMPIVFSYLANIGFKLFARKKLENEYKTS